MPWEVPDIFPRLSSDSYLDPVLADIGKEFRRRRKINFDFSFFRKMSGSRRGGFLNKSLFSRIRRDRRNSGQTAFQVQIAIQGKRNLTRQKTVLSRRNNIFPGWQVSQFQDPIRRNEIGSPELIFIKQHYTRVRQSCDFEIVSDFFQFEIDISIFIQLARDFSVIESFTGNRQEIISGRGTVNNRHAHGICRCGIDYFAVPFQLDNRKRSGMDSKRSQHPFLLNIKDNIFIQHQGLLISFPARQIDTNLEIFLQQIGKNGSPT
ncbi:MAG: hypothetical protein IKO93_16055, partial [Lentisphaeria bacterium]|nr:hypothetical protein [Lentisphaeria bacterium]